MQATSWLRPRLSIELWRRVHLLSAPLFVIAGVHGWLIGTDAGHLVVLIVAAVLLAEVAFVLGLRLRHGRRPLPVRIP